MKHRLLVPALALALTSGLFAAPISFDFKDPKGVNNVVFLLDAPLESINGTATGISGKVDFDPANPAALKGKIVVAANSMHVPNPMMKEHLHGAQWMDVQKFPELTFETESVANVKTTGEKTTADVTGTMTVKGIAKKITVPVQLTYLKDKLKDRLPQLNGDILVLRSKFTIKRSDYNISAGRNEDKVANEIELTLSLAGQAPR